MCKGYSLIRGLLGSQSCVCQTPKETRYANCVNHCLPDYTGYMCLYK